MSEPLKCAECGVELTVADAEDAVPTDAGPVHRECFAGPVPPPAKADDFLDEFEPLAEEAMTPEEIEAENERRAEMGDPPIPWSAFPDAMIAAEARGRVADAIIFDDFPVLCGEPISEAAYRATEGFDDEPEEPGVPYHREGGPHCPECGDPVARPGRCFTCRGRSML